MNRSGVHADHPAPAVLRLLPEVSPPPARLLLLGHGPAARALDARGYDVTVVDAAGVAEPGGVPVLAADFVATDFGGRFDLLCEHGQFRSHDGAAYVAAAARALRPGGLLFGAFDVSASDLLHAFAPAFDVVTSRPAGGDGPWLEVVLRRR